MLFSSCSQEHCVYDEHASHLSSSRDGYGDSFDFIALRFFLAALSISWNLFILFSFFWHAILYSPSILFLALSLLPPDKRFGSPERGKQQVRCCTSFTCFPGVFISSLPQKQIGSAKQIANVRESKSVFAPVGRSSDSPPGFERRNASVACEFRELRALLVSFASCERCL